MFRRHSVRTLSWLAATLALGCSGSAADRASNGGEATGTVIESIIGASPASSYVEGALVNMRAVNGAGYACTGTLIAPKVVLTAGHCVDGMTSWDVTVGGAHRASTSAETFDWNENGSEQVNPLHHDIGLVYLSNAITLPSYPTLATGPVADGTMVVNVGRIKDGTFTNSLYQAKTTVRGALRAGYPFDYYSTDVIQPGDSGGPVFVDGTHTLVAVNSGAGSGTQVLARVDLLAGWIAARVSAHGEAKDSSDVGTSGRRGRLSAPGDAGAPPSAAEPSGGAADAGAVCADEVEPNDSFATATPLGAQVCAKLQSGTDVDWFTFSAAAGTTVLSVGGGDATFVVGYALAGQCLPILSGQRSVRITVPLGTAAICAAVTSPSHTAGAYTLSRSP